jgi:hypothetical protein
MLEDLGKCTGNKHSEALVQMDIKSDGLNNRIQDERQSLSGNIWTGEIDNAMTSVKQMEKESEGQKIVQDSEERSKLAARDYMVCHRLFGSERTGALAPSVSWETYRHIAGGTTGELARGYFQKRDEISNCGFGAGLERTQRQAELQEMQESRRRIRQLDLKPYMWNTVDIRL